MRITYIQQRKWQQMLECLNHSRAQGMAVIWNLKKFYKYFRDRNNLEKYSSFLIQVSMMAEIDVAHLLSGERRKMAKKVGHIFFPLLPLKESANKRKTSSKDNSIFSYIILYLILSGFFVH